MKWILLLAVLTAAIYLPSLLFQRTFDNVMLTTDEYPVVSIADVWRAAVDPQHTTRAENGQTGRMWTAIFQNGRPLPVQHGVSILLHLGVGLLLWRWLRDRVSSSIALGALAIFWLHPIQTEAVAYVNAQPELWIAAGAMAVLYGLDIRGARGAACAVAGFIVAYESKEIGVWTIVPIASLTLAMGYWRSRLTRGLVLAIVGAVVVRSAIALYGDYGGLAYMSRFHWAASESCLAAGVAFRILVPIGMYQQAYASCDLVHPLVQVAALAACGIVVLFVAVRIIEMRRLAKMPEWVVLALLWTIVWLAPRWEGPIDFRGEGYLTEHHFYVPMLLLSVAMAVAVEAAIAWTKTLRMRMR